MAEENRRPEFQFLVSFIREQKASRESHLILGAHLIAGSFIKSKKKMCFPREHRCSGYENKSRKHPHRCWAIQVNIRERRALPLVMGFCKRNQQLRNQEQLTLAEKDEDE